MLRKLIMILLIGAICLLGVIPVIAQEQYSTMEEYEKATGKKITKFNEAPVLRTKVATGELPPVEERLPEEPAVIKPVEEIGQYGGTWHRAALSPGDTQINGRMGYDPIICWTSDAKSVEPNVAKKWEISEGGKVFTFYLRKGMKWSDGKPFTADDIMFWYEDILSNKELNPSFPKWLIIGGKPGKTEKIDDYTIRFRFAKPYGLFFQQLAFQGYNAVSHAPKHYLKQFHPRYTSKKKLEDLTKKAGFELWYQLFGDRNSLPFNPDLPTVRAWKLTVPPPATRMVAERNPYYWKVDPEGNQLPYIDRVAYDIVSDPEMINFKAMTGGIDMQLRHIMWDNYTLFMEGREKGDYRVLRWMEAYGSNAGILLNHSDNNPVLRKLFHNLKFRMALSYALNREEINELCYLGLGVPRAATQIPLSPYYQKDLENLYAEYNPDKAKKLLDEVGLTKKDDQGYRLRPDGKRLSLIIELTPRFGPWPDVAGLIKEYWEAVGIKASVKVEDRSLLDTRTNASECDIHIWTDPGYLLINEWPYVVARSNTRWAPLYGLWCVSGGKSGEKPPEYILKNMELYEQLNVTVDSEKHLKIAKEIVRNAAEELYTIGTVGSLPALVIVKNDFRNVPEKAVSAWTLLSPGYTHIEQYFIKQK